MSERIPPLGSRASNSARSAARLYVVYRQNFDGTTWCHGVLPDEDYARHFAKELCRTGAAYAFVTQPGTGEIFRARGAKNYELGASDD